MVNLLRLLNYSVALIYWSILRISVSWSWWVCVGCRSQLWFQWQWPWPLSQIWCHWWKQVYTCSILLILHPTWQYVYDDSMVFVYIHGNCNLYIQAWYSVCWRGCYGSQQREVRCGRGLQCPHRRSDAIHHHDIHLFIRQSLIISFTDEESDSIDYRPSRSSSMPG